MTQDQLNDERLSEARYKVLEAVMGLRAMQEFDWSAHGFATLEHDREFLTNELEAVIGYQLDDLEIAIREPLVEENRRLTEALTRLRAAAIDHMDGTWGNLQEHAYVFECAQADHSSHNCPLIAAYESEVIS